MTLPVWQLTRTSAGRQLFETLAAAGIVLSRLEQFEHVLESPIPSPSPPDEVSLSVDHPDALALPEEMERPSTTAEDRVVTAVADDRIVGVQPVTIDRPVFVEPLERSIDFDGAYFWGLYVDAEWRRRHVASALVTRALSFVDDRTEQTRVQTLIGVDNVPSKRVLGGAGFERNRVRSYYRLFGLHHRSQREVERASSTRTR